MATLLQPSNIHVSRGNSCIFFHWAPVPKADAYEIEIENTLTNVKTVHRTTCSSLFRTHLDNGTYYKYQVKALNETEFSELSVPFIQRPIFLQGECALSAQQTDTPGQIFLTWTANPTDFGFKLSRCDIGSKEGHKTIGWFPYNQTTIYEDQTNCNSSQSFCSGHFYSLSFRDCSFATGGGLLSKRVFCKSQVSTETVPITEEIISSDFAESR